MKLKEIRLKVPTRDLGIVAIQAFEIGGGLAINHALGPYGQAKRGLWKITHIGTGYCFPWFIASKPAAMAIGARLLALRDWTATTLAEIEAEAHAKAAVYQAAKAIAVEFAGDLV